MTHTATASRSYCTGSRWSALNIVLMVIGFAVFWPLGLAMLAWIVWGDEIGRRAGDFKAQFRGFADRAWFRPLRIDLQKPHRRGRASLRSWPPNCLLNKEIT